MEIYNITAGQLIGAGILNSFEIAAGGASFTNTRSLDFDGTDDFVGMGTGTLLFNRTDTFTFSVWVKMHQSELSVIIGKAFNGGDFDGYMLWQNASGGKNTLNFRLRKNTSQLVQILSTSTFNLNQWYHVAVTYDGSGANTGLKLYVDGINQAGTRSGTLTQNLVWPEPARPFNVGARMNGNLPFNGLIDEVGVFDSELSQTNITNIYNSGVPASLASFSPIHWWRFEEGSGTTAVDSGTGGLNGTLTNGPTYSTDVPS